MTSASYRVALTSGWSAWRWFRLKSAGFPAAMVDALETTREASAVDQWLESGAPLDETLMALLGQARQRCGLVLRDVARLPAFRRALLWQNRSALHGGLASLLRKGEGVTSSKLRGHERLVLRYLQRYCLKNDTVGFFGPTGWGTFTNERRAIRSEPGPGLISRRVVQLEYWCLNAVATRLSDDLSLRAQLVPRLAPTVALEGESLVVGDLRKPVSRVIAETLSLCDGRPASAVVATLVEREVLGELDDGYALLTALADKGVVLWGFSLPTSTSGVEHVLRAQLEALDETFSGSRAKALATLDVLEDCRRALLEAPADEVVIDERLRALNRAFTVATGESSQRRNGELYAARALACEDTLRDLTLEAGEALRDMLGPPLALVLQSARWFTFELAQRYRAAFLSCFHQGETSLPFATFFKRASAHLPGQQNERTAIVTGTVAELRARWRSVLNGRTDLRSDELTAAVEEAFAAPGPGWPGARYHSPDLMIAAASVEAINRGECTLVLGEVHPSANTLMPQFALELHPNPEALLRARDADIATRCVSPLESQGVATRADHLAKGTNDFDLELGPSTSAKPRELVLQAKDLVVEATRGDFRVRTLDHRLHFDGVAFFERFLTFACISHFSLFEPAAHQPRVTIDRLVIGRQTWRFSSATMPWAHSRASVERCFIELRKWSRANHLPRRVFARVDSEPKPIAFDLESIAFVESFVRLVEANTSITLSEMLPGPDQLWLTDSESRKYTSELRLAAVDPVPWEPLT